MGAESGRGFKLCLALFLISGWALHEGHGWRTQQEYVYRMEGRTVAGFLSLDTQGVGVHYLASVRVQAVSDAVLLLKVEDAKYVKIQEDMADSWWKRFQQPGDQWQALPITDTTVVVNHDDGVVRSIAYSPDLAEWEVNFLQGVAGHLQVNLAPGSDLVSQDLSNTHGRRKKGPNSSVYKVVENGVAGRCEVMYEVAKVSKAHATLGSDWPDNTHVCGSRSLLDITKTVNYSNCQHSAEYHVGLPSSAADCNAGSSICADFWQRVFVTRMRGCGDQKDFTVLDSVGTSRQLANLQLHEESGAAINSYLNLSLVSTEQVSQLLPTVSRPSVHKNLVYLYRPQELEERSSRHARAVPAYSSHRPRKPHHEAPRPRTPLQPDATSSEEEGSREPAAMPPPDAYNPQQLAYCPQFLARRAREERSQLVEDFHRAVVDLTADLGDPQRLQSGPGLILLEAAVVLTRPMTRSELQAATGQVFDGSDRHSDTERKLVMDILAMSGTHPAFHIIKELIESEKISKESAADVISSVPHHLSAPTISLLDDFSSLMTSPAVKKDQQLFITTIFAFSNLVRAACVSPKAKKASYTEEVFRADACSSHTAERYLRQLISLAKQHQGLQTVMVAALGNTGLPGALPIVASVIASDSSAYVRSMAVFALRHYTALQPAATVSILLAAYHRQENPLAVRMSAVALLWFANPPLAVWQRLAISTWYEKDPAIVAFIDSSLYSFSRTEHPGWQEMQRNAQAALRLVKHAPSGLERAYNVIWSATSNKLNSVVVKQLEWIYNFRFSALYYYSTSQLGGLRSFNFEAEFDVANPDSLLTSLGELVAPQYDALTARPPLQDLPRSTSDIAKTLGVALKGMPGLEGAIRYRTNHLAERMLPFGKKLPLELAKAGRNLAAQLQQGKVFHLQKLDMRMLMLETTNEMGFPVSFKLSVPCAIRLSGEAKLTADYKHFAVDASAFHARQLLGELMVYTPWDRTLHVAGTQGAVVVAPPALRLNARLDAASNLLQLELKPSRRAPGGGAAHYRTTPYLSQRDARAMPPSKQPSPVRVSSPKKLEYRDREVIFSYESDDTRGVMERLGETVSVLGFPVLSDLRASSANLQLAEMPPVVAVFGLGKAAVKKGELVIWSAPQEGQPWPADILDKGATVEFMLRDSEDDQQNYEQTSDEASPRPIDDPASKSSSSPAASWETPNDIFGSESSSSGGSSASSASTETEECAEAEEIRPQTSFVVAKMEPFAPAVNATEYLLRQSLSDFYYGRAFVVSANVSVNSLNPHNYSAFLVHAVPPFSSERKIGLFVKELTSNWQMKLGYYAQEPLLPLFSFNEHILKNLSMLVYTDLELQVNDTKYTASFSGEASHKDGTPAAIVSAWRQQGCALEECSEVPLFNKKCRNLLYKSANYDLYSAAISYNEEVKDALPEDGSLSAEAVAVLQPYLGEQNDAARGSGSLGKAGFTAYIADDGSTMDLVFTTPGSTRIYRDVPAPFPDVEMPSNPAAVASAAVYRPPTCILGKNRLATYDGVELEYGINSCWHVATMDCSGKSKVAVLARRKGEQMEMELNADNYKIISVLPGPRVLVNGEQLDLSHGNMTQVEDEQQSVFAEVLVSPDDAVRVDLLAHGLRVFYDKSAAYIEAKARLAGRMCGLCGDLDGDLADALTGPSGHTMPTANDFGRSYLLQDSDCEAEQLRPSHSFC